MILDLQYCQFRHSKFNILSMFSSLGSAELVKTKTNAKSATKYIFGLLFFRSNVAKLFVHSKIRAVVRTPRES